MSLSVKFEQFDIDYANAQLLTNEMRLRADDEPTQERVDAATAAREAQAAICRKFRNWCAQKRDGIARELGDPARKFSATERAEWQERHDEVVKRLAELEV